MNKLSVFLLAVAITPACTIKSSRPDFGVSYEGNNMVQALDPAAGQRDLPPSPMDGVKANQAIENYYKDKPKVDNVRIIKDVGG